MVDKNFTRGEKIGIVGIGLSVIIALTQVYIGFLSYETNQLEIQRQMNLSESVRIRTAATLALQMNQDIKDIQSNSGETEIQKFLVNRLSAYSSQQLMQLSRLEEGVRLKMQILDYQLK